MNPRALGGWVIAVAIGLVLLVFPIAAVFAAVVILIKLGSDRTLVE